MEALGQNVPAGHVVACELPAGQTVEALHFNCIADVEPAGHAKPPEHRPDATLIPVIEQNEPGVHSFAAASPGASHSEPTGHVVDTELPTGQYVDALHCTWIADDEPV